MLYEALTISEKWYNKYLQNLKYNELFQIKKQLDTN